MTRRPNYKSLQRAIARDDKRGIEARWAFGRAVLADPKKMAPSGKSLRNGAIEALIADAEAVGAKLSEREIRYRIQCARAYRNLGQIRHACAGFEDWSSLREAGFPAAPDEDVAPQLSLLDDLEKRDAQEFEQLNMFPEIVRGVPLESACLGHLVAYAAEMAAMTESYARRDSERAAHLAELVAAVGGDLEVLYPAAVNALALKESA